MKRNATAVWNGTGKEGSGHLSTQSTVLDKTQYSFSTRFADGIGTNPEELMAAAHAGCFTMKLSFDLNEAGCTADEIKTTCVITLENGTITSSDLKVNASVPGLDEARFQEIAESAKANCPVSKAYAALNISLQATLNT